MLLKNTFLALKRTASLRRKARLFQRKSLLFRSLQALTLYQMQEAKVKTMQDKLTAKRICLAFDGFID